MRLRTLFLACCLPITGLVVAPSCFASSAPPGRAWTMPVALAIPGVTGFTSADFVRDEAGRPGLVVGTFNGSLPAYWGLLGWRDSAFVDSISSHQVAAGTIPRVILDASGRPTLACFTSLIDVNGYVRLALWGVDAAVAAPETVGVTTTQLGTYSLSADVGGTRRWMSRIDQPPNQPFLVHTFVSDAPGQWRKLADQGQSEYNSVIAAVDDSTALLLYTGDYGAWWTTSNGSTFAPRQPFARPAWGSTFLPRTAGGLWLVSTDLTNVQVDAWSAAGWSHEATVQSLRDPGDGFLHVDWPQASLETGARPALAWQEGWPLGPTWHTSAHAAWPTETGWTVGYEAPASDGMGLGPSVALDVDHDLWLAWDLYDSPSVFVWTHSYVTATADTPHLSASGQGIRVDWSLSTSAPDSWWAVMRDGGDGALVPVVRVHAGDATALTWTDPSPPAPGEGSLRYAIRRESIDTRTTWTSAAATWGTTSVPGPRVGRPALRLAAGQNPVGGRARLRVSGAAPGQLTVRLYDLRGREIMRTGTDGSGPEREVGLDVASLPPGVYLARAVDGSGRSSPSIKLVRVRD